MLGVIMLSAYMRLAQTGLGCAVWPDCQGEVLRQAATTLPVDSARVLWARRVHRMLASVTLLLTVVLVLIALLPRPRLWPQGRLAMALVLLALWLAGLGIGAGRSGLPAVVLGNLLGGFAMLPLAWRLAAPVNADAGRGPGTLRSWAHAGLLLLVLQIVLGGLISAAHGASACDSWSACASVVSQSGWSWQHLNPWLATTPDMVAPLQARGALLQWLHHLGALLLLPVLAIVAWKALRQRQIAPALALYLLLVTQLMLGLLLAPLGFGLAQVLLHNVVAVLLLTLLARWA